MGASEEMVKILNDYLESVHFDRIEFCYLIEQLKVQFKADIKFLDFEFYNEARMESARNSKLINVKLQDFNAAFEYRQVEYKCLKNIELKTQYHIDKSSLYYEKDILFYFCFGTARNDKIVRRYLEND